MTSGSERPADDCWDELAPLLDDGLGRLRGRDRDLLLWRFFEGRSVREIALNLEISEEAAAKRLSRAVEQLRDFFRRRGVAVSAAALSAVLVSQTSEAAPAGLASAACVGAVHPAAATVARTSLAKGALVMASVQKLKLVGVVVLIVLLGIGGILPVLRHRSAGANASSPPGGVAIAATGGMIRFSDGSDVDVVGIQEQNPTGPGTWWGPDGLPCADPQYAGGAELPQSAGMRNIRFIFRVSAADANNKSLKVVVFPPGPASNSDVRGNGFFTRQLIAAVPRDLAVGTVRIGIAGGAFKDELSYDLASGQTTRDDASVRLGAISESNGQTWVEVYPLSLRNTQRDERLVLIADGHEIQANEINGRMFSTTYRFNCRRSNVTKAVFRTRPFEWMEIRNVSLYPIKEPTDVQIAPITAATTAP